MKTKDNNFIIFEDDSILVISKPAGMLTIPDRYDYEAPNLKQELEQIYGKIFVVHRLDKDTSGIMVFCKDADSHKHLNGQFQENKVDKLYHVVVSGIVQQDDIDIDIPIIPDPAVKGKSKPSAKGKESLTKLKVVERFRVATFVECDLITGRHHQIRVHCAAIGHPLLVDKLYGKNSEFYLSSIKRKFNLKKNTEEIPVISRVTMHSYSIAFNHPVTNERMSFLASYPKDFNALLNIMRKYAGFGNFAF